MTEQEAIKELEAHIQFLKLNWKPHPDYNVVEALGTAIKALETVQKLKERNITMEVLENYMQFEDECVKKGFTLKSILEAREKQIAKSAKITSKVEDAEYMRCPACRLTTVLYSGMRPLHCPNCGQKLDFNGIAGKEGADAENLE